MEKVLTATVLPRSRLGKRSPLGALVCNSSAEGLVDIGGHGDTDGVPVISGIGAGVHGVHRVKLHPGQRVSRSSEVSKDDVLSILLSDLFLCVSGVRALWWTRACWRCGAAQPRGQRGVHIHTAAQSARAPETGGRVVEPVRRPRSPCVFINRRAKKVWFCFRQGFSVCLNRLSLVLIFSDLLFRSVESADMDEIMAAMVLTSLSCSPMIQSPVHGEPAPGWLTSRFLV